jgi:hypothetical protein
MRSVRCERRPGLGKAEVIVLLLIVLTAVGFLIAVLPGGHAASDRVKCAFHLKQIGEAIHGFQQRRGGLPPSRLAGGHATWAVLIAPDLFARRADPLHAWDLSRPYYEQPEELRQAQIPLYYCPARRQPPQNSTSGDVPGGDPAGKLYPGALGDYACATGNGARAHPWDTAQANGAMIPAEVRKREGDRILEWSPRVTLDMLKGGMSYTILLGEKHVPRGQFGRVAAGDGSLYNGEYMASFARVGGPDHPLAGSPDDPFNRNFGSYHLEVCQFLLADGSVRPMTPSVSTAVLGAMTVRPGPSEEKKP